MVSWRPTRKFLLSTVALVLLLLGALSACGPSVTSHSSAGRKHPAHTTPTPIVATHVPAHPASTPAPTPTATLQPVLTATFTGIALLVIDDPSIGYIPPQPISFTAQFNTTQQTSEVVKFSPFETPPTSTALGSNTTTISLLQADTGTFNTPQRGSLSMPLTLQFTESIGCPFACPSDLPIQLSTDATTFASTTGLTFTGSPLDSLGDARLVSSGTFHGGSLDNKKASLLLSGAFTPSPISS